MSLKRLPNGEIEFGQAKRLPHGYISCFVKLTDYNDEVAEFIAAPDDSEAYGRELYEMLNTKYLHLVEEVTQEEIDTAAADDAKCKRRVRLKDSDWTQLPDVPSDIKEAWKAYRQLLRDITIQDGYPHNIIWPEPPE